VVVDVETDDADDGRWLAEFLAPWAGVTAAGAGVARVRLTRSSDVVEALGRRRASGAAELMPCFALDHETVRLPGWADDGRTWLADDDMECLYGVRGSRVDVVGRDGKRRVRLGLMRVVREILCQGLPGGGGYLDVHAAAFEVEGRAVLLVGGRGAGKTTLLCHALASGRAGFVANDRVIIAASGQPVVAQGVPTVVSLRPGTVEAFPRLRLRAVEHPVILHSAEPEPASPEFGEKRRGPGTST
jgi:hypothetical protein